jgi:superfamily II DNA or RNA helicase
MAENIILRDYQHEPFKFLNSDFEKLVLAMCPSSGKTETVIYYIDQLFKQKKDLKVLILPHSTNVLLNNFYDRLQNRNVNFTYSTDTSVNCNVHIVLPQSKAKIKDEYDLLIVDEAHENYFANTVQEIIIKTKPKKQILLTGTPYQFIGRQDFKIHFLALNELDKNTIPKLRVDIIESNYQWNGNYNSVGEVKKQFDFNETDTKTTLDKTFKFILNRNNSEKKSVSKTLIVCNSIKQSEFVKSYLDSIDLYSVISNSKNDIKSLLVQDFKLNKINILIVVNRARLGYDDIDLINLIDMSGTLNPNLIYQMIARVLRGSNDVQKYYIRLTSKKDESLNSEIATNLAFMLTDKKYISTFNGKNFNQKSIIIPKSFSKKYISTVSNFIENSPKLLVSTDDVISFYRDTISDIEKENGIYKFCQVKDVLIELGDKKKARTLQDCKKIALNYKYKKDWNKFDGASYSYAIRKNWLDECCKHMESFYPEKNIEDIKKIALNFEGRYEWQKKDNKSYSYAKRKNWLDECCKHMKELRKKYTLESCKESASKFKTIRDWDNADNNSVLASRRNGWYKECISHMDALLVWRTLEECKKSAFNYTVKEDWKKGDGKSYQSARNNGWYEECTAHMKQHSFKHYTLEYCKEVALKYNKNADFYKKDYNVFSVAYRKGWLDECRKHMTEIRENRILNLDNLINIASNFYTKKEWRKTDLPSYETAYRKGWLEECAKNFKK